ncbi:MAG: NADH-quinone oxidoreductase subunit N [Deltaproteobacteria bacterium]|nr:NADH-quinone oxidoreductase subunit N [Deltaproteobacteria bacterium]
MLRDLNILLPLLLVGGTGCFVLLLDVFSRRTPESPTAHLGWFSALGNLAAFAVILRKWVWGGVPLRSPFLQGVLSTDLYSLYLWAAISLFVALSSLASVGYDRENRVHHGEYYALLSFAGLGMMLIVAATDLLVFFVALELLSLAIYGLVALKRFSPRAAEAGFKYFFTGALASAVLLYGMTLVWGETGTLSYFQLGSLLPAGASALAYAGLLLILTGFAFKVALAPFHLWTPDAYEGAPGPVTGLMASGVKVAAFGALFRFFFVSGAGAAGAPFGVEPGTILLVLSLATLFLGSLVALHQTDVKRILAYSSVVHAGYLGLGVLALPPSGDATLAGSLPFYLVAYGLSNVGAFAVLSMLESRQREAVTLESLRGLARRRPLAAFALTVFLASLAGFPPTVGFLGKYYLFRDLILLSHGALTWVVVVAVGASLVSVWYYLAPVVSMYMKEPEEEPAPLAGSSAMTVALVVSLLAVLGLGLLPGPLAHRAKRAAAAVRVSGRTPPADVSDLSRFAHPTEK